LFEETHGLACNHLVPEHHKASWMGGQGPPQKSRVDPMIDQRP
jgi:hypothetical protein